MAAYTNYRRDPRVRREAEALTDAGHQVVFFASRQAGEPNRETISGVDVIKTFGLRNHRNSIVVYILDYLLFFSSLFFHLLIRPRRYALIHINNMPDFLVFAAVVPRLLGVPVIHDVHDLMPELFEEKFHSSNRRYIVEALKVQERWAGAFASAVLTVEEGLKEILAKRGIRRDKIQVLMNLPDDKIFSQMTPRTRRCAETPFVLVYHGTLARRLGLDIAIQAVTKARVSIPNIQFRIIGDGEERANLVALRNRLGLQTVVTFSPGFVPVHEVPTMISDADVGVIPLRVSSGTDVMLPTKLLEYVSMGIPCVVPRTSTIARYFDEEMVAFFEAEDSDSLAQALVALHLDPPRRIALANEATKRFGSIYNWSRHKRIYVDLVNRLLPD